MTKTRPTASDARQRRMIPIAAAGAQYGDALGLYLDQLLDDALDDTSGRNAGLDRSAVRRTET